MYKYKNTVIKLFQGDITKVKADGIVNAANNTLLGGGGVDGAIHRAGGPEILEQCKRIGGCPTGEARITTAGKLPSKYVIHTVGPIYRKGNSREAELLHNAYFNSLKLAKEYSLKSVAFPSISTGIYSYPIDEASDIAIKSIIEFIDKEDFIEEIIFVLFNDKDFSIYENKLNKIFR